MSGPYNFFLNFFVPYLFLLGIVSNYFFPFSLTNLSSFFFFRAVGFRREVFESRIVDTNIESFCKGTK